MKGIIFSTFLFLSTALNAQIHEWAIPLGGDWFDFGHAVCVDDSGYVYSTGAFSTTSDFDPSIWRYNLVSEGQYDIYVHKADSAGNLVWAKGMGSSGFDFGESIAVDKDGNVYTTGYFTNTVDFDPGPDTFNLSSAGTQDIFVQKLDASGDFVWAIALGANNTDLGRSIMVDDSSNVYVTGSFMSSVDFDPDTSTFVINAGANSDVFILKLDSAGDFKWVGSIDGISIQRGLSFVRDASGNIYTTGYYSGTADFDPGTATNNLTAVGTEDVFVQKMDANGNFIWAKSIGGMGNERAESITVDHQGNLIITGLFSNMIDLDPGTGVVQRSSSGNVDIFIVKLDPSGNYVWGVNLGGTSRDRGESVVADNFGNVYVFGQFGNTVDFDPGTATVNLTHQGSNDAFLLKLDALGNFLWVESFGSFDIDIGEGIALDQHNNIYTTGYFQSQVDFDPGTGVDNLLSAGWNDCFVHKLSQINTSVGLSGEKHENKISLLTYPNPSQGVVQIQLEKAMQEVSLELRDVSGKLVYQENYSSLLNTSIELNQPAGLYFLSLKTVQSQTIIKLVKE